MKKLFLLTCLLSICSFGKSQNLLTIGEVFDFEINDEFHYQNVLVDEPSDGDRVTIINKYYTDSGRKVHYVRFHQIYDAFVVWNAPTPYIDYIFTTNIDSVSYGNLDSLITTYQIGFEDTTESNDACNTLINTSDGCSGNTTSGCKIKSYGAGIGKTRDYEYYAFSGNPSGILWDHTLVYYKKGSLQCGNPDSTVGIKNKQDLQSLIKVFPNPVTSHLHVQNFAISGNFEFQLFNSLGEEVFSRKIIGNNSSIETGSLLPGIYFVKIIMGDMIITKKIIKD